MYLDTEYALLKFDIYIKQEVKMDIEGDYYSGSSLIGASGSPLQSHAQLV